ncbi:MAG: 50S ribosomal protein L25 [Candidatus Fermentithermobacillus carboniphilus]|uniref:Large ribosomal subunit protein bL25 n=1 Tax=Candidatus Fermentithermobacillus carboniphilus TaxID=3085328 RepID=A0AAT9L9T7_9FIRM|nr:MAG: 50S ribosomal protein L25 [Candidatus Fermentithermobacillus carboniphilus]
MTDLDQDVIFVKPRATGKGAARACRREGLVPAIVYGKNTEPVPVALDSKAVRQLFARTQGHIHHIVMEDPKFEADVMVQDVARDPITGSLLHLDLHKISLTEKVRAEVPITIVGETELEKKGLILQRQLREITVECLPAEIPDSVVLDVSGLSVGDTVTAGELSLPSGIRLVTSPSEVVAVAVAPKIGGEMTEAEAGEGAQKETGGTEEKPATPHA